MTSKTHSSGCSAKPPNSPGRLARAVDEERAPQFRDRVTDAAVAVDLTGVARVEPMIVTLSDLGWLAARRHALRDLGVLPTADDAVPWVVSIFDLELITKLVKHPAELTRYIALRHTLDHRVLATDELELWLQYIDQSLDFSTVDATMIMLSGRVERYDDCSLHSRCSAPRLKLPRRHQRRLEAVDRENAGWLQQAEGVIAEVQAHRNPTAYPATRPPNLVICAPQDPNSRPRTVSQLGLALGLGA